MPDIGVRLALTLLCGIPGSGKTTLASRLRRHMRKAKGETLHMIHICFDDLIPSDLELNCTPAVETLRNEEKTHTKDNVFHLQGLNNPSEVTLWKSCRKNVLESAEKVLRLIQSKDTQDECSELEVRGRLPSFKGFWKTFEESVSSDDRNCPCCTQKSWRWSNDVHVILIDDNMFYHSMRYEYAQLARKYSAGFAEVFLECPLEVAEKRNKLRSSEVTNETIRTMIKRMEPPEPDKFTWEKHNLTIDASLELETGTMERITSLIYDALENPLLPIPEENLEEKEKSRVACLTSIIHQADQILRKYIATVMEQATRTGKERTDLQLLASKLNKERKQFLGQLRDIKAHSESATVIREAITKDCSHDTLIQGGNSDPVTKDINSAALVKGYEESVSSTVLQEPKLSNGGLLNAVDNLCSAQNSSSEDFKTCLCVFCLPDVDDKKKFQSFIEQLFRRKTKS